MQFALCLIILLTPVFSSWHHHQDSKFPPPGYPWHLQQEKRKTYIMFTLRKKKSLLIFSKSVSFVRQVRHSYLCICNLSLLLSLIWILHDLDYHNLYSHVWQSQKCMLRYPRVGRHKVLKRMQRAMQCEMQWSHKSWQRVTMLDFPLPNHVSFIN